MPIFPFTSLRVFFFLMYVMHDEAGVNLQPLLATPFFTSSGLDPAEPYFQAAGASVCLDTSDAAFVDVIHTDGLAFNSNLGMHQN